LTCHNLSVNLFNVFARTTVCFGLLLWPFSRALFSFSLQSVVSALELDLFSTLFTQIYIFVKLSFDVLDIMADRFFPSITGRPIFVDFSPVTDFREATCRQYEENVCNRGGYCNFMHLKKISRSVS
jgi:hypothetical protein